MRFTQRIHAPGFGRTESPAAANGQGRPIPTPRMNGSTTAQVFPAAHHFAVSTSVASRIGSTHAPARTAAPTPSRKTPPRPRILFPPPVTRLRYLVKSMKNTSLIASPSIVKTMATSRLNHGLD